MSWVFAYEYSFYFNAQFEKLTLRRQVWIENVSKEWFVSFVQIKAAETI